MRRNKRSKKPYSGGARVPHDVSHLPQMMPLSIVKSVKRYGVNIATTIAVDSKDLLMSGGAMCTVVGSTLTALFASVRLRRVRIWAPLSTTAVPSTLLTNVCLLWGGAASQAAGATQLLITDQTLSSVTPAYIDAKPPRGIQASWWRQTDTVENLFQIFSYDSTGALSSVPAGTIIEIHAEFAQNALGGVVSTLNITTGTLGQTYYPTLDSSGNKRAFPLGLLSTV